MSIDRIRNDFQYTFKDVSEIFDTISEEFSTDGCSASVTLECDWQDRHNVVEYFLHKCNGWEGALPPLIREGARYPQLSPLSFVGGMEAQKVTVSPLPTRYNNAGQACDYLKARIRVDYATNTPEVSIQSTSEYLTLNPDGFEFSDPAGMPLAAEEAPGIIMHSHTITINRKRVPNFIEYPMYEGCVNASEVNFRDWFPQAYPPGTLLCGSPSLRRHAVAGLFDVSLTLSYRKIPWNKFFHPKAGGETLLEKVTDIVDRETKIPIKLAPEVDFTALLNALGIF